MSSREDVDAKLATILLELEERLEQLQHPPQAGSLSGAQNRARPRKQEAASAGDLCLQDPDIDAALVKLEASRAPDFRCCLSLCGR